MCRTHFCISGLRWGIFLCCRIWMHLQVIPKAGTSEGSQKKRLLMSIAGRQAAVTEWEVDPSQSLYLEHTSEHSVAQDANPERQNVLLSDVVESSQKCQVWSSHGCITYWDRGLETSALSKRRPPLENHDVRQSGTFFLSVAKCHSLWSNCV